MLEVVAVKSDSDLLGSAGVSPAVFGVPPNTRRTPAVNPLGETPSGATETVALPEFTHFQSHPQLPIPLKTSEGATSQRLL